LTDVAIPPDNNAINAKEAEKSLKYNNPGIEIQ
jgi:hypothetical protein